MARRRFFVDSLQSGRAQISGDDAHHLTRVLRVEAGQKFELSDNQCVYLAEVESVRKDLVSFRILEALEAAPQTLQVTLYASLIRFERFEWMIEKATELGVRRIIPLQADRGETGLEKAAPKRLARWNRVAREASEQSRRTHLPAIAEPVSLTTALRDTSDVRLALEETSAPAILDALPPTRQATDRAAMLIGPEGGWTDRERGLFTDAAWNPVSLGREILRSETAAVAALAILNAAWAVK